MQHYCNGMDERIRVRLTGRLFVRLSVPKLSVACALDRIKIVLSYLESNIIYLVVVCEKMERWWYGFGDEERRIPGDWIGNRISYSKLDPLHVIYGFHYVYVNLITLVVGRIDVLRISLRRNSPQQQWKRLQPFWVRTNPIRLCIRGLLLLLLLTTALINRKS